ncbi:cytoplasmic dynein 2 intermediate chain 1 isoform X2 [Antennarius striatus]|uniref:cytoplasmic dynein 2 intermediate chain 1 isoform X2 n=1 Tax=Antennarius striatus TaxID=241820 RepID=UPI0035AEE48B
MHSDKERRHRDDRKHRGGESTDRRHRDTEKESRRERDKQRERDNIRERGYEDEKVKYADRRKEGSQDRRGDRDRHRKDDRNREMRQERDKLVDGRRYDDVHKQSRARSRDSGEKHEIEREKERHIYKERERDRERQSDKDREKKREERDRRKSEERDREHRVEKERRRHKDSREERGDRVERYEREKRDQHREAERHKYEYIDNRNDKERRERRGDKHLDPKEDREHIEDRGKHKEERERRHKERRYHDEKRRHDHESREHRDSKRSGEEGRHHRGDKERTERDKQKERRHREEDDDVERQNQRDRINSGKSASEKSHGHETKTKDVATISEHETQNVKAVDTVEPERSLIVNNEDLADQEYEDDFEEYEDDFEELDESPNEREEEEPRHLEVSQEREELTAQRRKEIETIQRAIDEENERVGTSQSRQIMSREEEDESKWSRGSENNQSRGSQHGKFINFVAAKQREVSKKVAMKQKKRSTELLRLIDLDFSVTYSILDLPPVNEYDMYIRNFGNANTKQAYVQCNEDNADRDIQTEEIETCEKWTQHPSECCGACGDPNLSLEARDKMTTEKDFDSQRLVAFLRSASQVMVILLEEEQAEKESLRNLKSQKDTLSFSDGSLQLNTKLPFLYGRSISLVNFSEVQKHTMLSVHRPTTETSAVRLDSCTIICIWNIWEPSRPQKVLVYESEVQCCCFSPGKAILVFAGTSVGSVVLWDLREHPSNHYRLKIGEDEWTFRQPTFSTDAVMGGSGHLSSVTSVEVVPSIAAGGLMPEVPLVSSEEDSIGLSFQLASLDETGVLNFWVVVELPKVNEAGSPTDLGLRPGGKVKLLHSSSLVTAERVSRRDATKRGPFQTLHLKFLPTDSCHFFIGTNMGLVNHGTTHGLKAPPEFYRFQEAGVRPVEVSSIHFSPFIQHLFLVGCGDGSIRLHAVSHEHPVAEWSNGTAGEPVVSLQWSQTRPTVFCVLDAASNIHIWDLLQKDSEPVVTERVHSDRVTAMAVFGDSGRQNIYSGIALAHKSGTIEVQYFTRNFTPPISGEEEKLQSMMTEAF